MKKKKIPEEGIIIVSELPDEKPKVTIKKTSK